MRERRLAITITFIVHGALLLLALLTQLREPDRGVDQIVLFFPVEATTATFSEIEETSKAPSVQEAEPPPPSPQPPSFRRDEVEYVEIDTVMDEAVWSVPKRALDADITPEQALVALEKLLEEHPEYKNLIVREMIAGSGFVRDSLPPVSFHLEDVMKFENFLPSWMYEAARMKGLHGGHSPVHGHWSPEQRGGAQIDVIGLYRFLKHLISGEK